ncbi:hypothetical protein HMI49_04035 [Corallococcus exercitus]|uniref:Uncharacterized protein n=1 Tax=Corallococcus exercitus TaxID=2316736 RepID=A0A7Y4KFL6_9BACT|nr:hypothetical protein [Corallococcus exercitus]NOK32370.1 hypothetical protein [Corallococcus exercitus]
MAQQPTREPTIRMQLLAVQTSLHAEACEAEGKPDARLVRCAHRVDEALAELNRPAGQDVRGQPPADWPAP